MRGEGQRVPTDGSGRGSARQVIRLARAPGTASRGGVRGVRVERERHRVLRSRLRRVAVPAARSTASSGSPSFGAPGDEAVEGATVQPYVIRQGDFLLKLGFELGFDADTVWQDPSNADLRALRPDPNILFPGDVLYVSDPPTQPTAGASLTPGSTNTFVSDTPTATGRKTFQRTRRHGDEVHRGHLRLRHR
jgi:hypothetical protein